VRLRTYQHPSYTPVFSRYTTVHTLHKGDIKDNNNSDYNNNKNKRGFSSLSESAYRGRQNQLAKIIQQQTAIKYKPLDRNTPLYYTYKPELVLESANRTLYWDRSNITDKTIDFNTAAIVLLERENKTALVTDSAVPLTHNLHKNEAEKIMKYENFALEITNVWKLNNMSTYTLVISLEGVVTTNFLKYLENTGLTKNILGVRQKAVVLQMCLIPPTSSDRWFPSM
jgi:hypothetical protein